MADRHILYKLLPLLQGGRVANAGDIELDSSVFSGNLDSNDNDVQELANAVDGLSISGGSNPNRFGGPIVPFTGSVTVNAGNYDTYIDAIALYVRSDDALVTFNLPSNSVINGRYPAVISILHQGGTSRDAGTTINPLNRVRVPDPAGGSGDQLRRQTGTRLQFFDVRQNDFAVFTKQSDADPWIVTPATLTTGALLLPDGVFNLKPETVFFRPSLSGIVGIPVGFVPQAGDAYRVGNDDSTFGGFGVQTDDVIVALIDGPSRLRSADNDDWLIIRNASNNTITLQELRFLNTITESDSFSDSRLMDRSDVQNVRVWLSDGILDHAPFITPTTDPNNPQDDGTTYAGGDELDGADFEFRDTQNRPTSLLYVDIDGSFDVVTELANTFIVIKDREGAEVNRLNLADDFRTITLSGSTDTYYVYDSIGAADNYSSINYINGYTIDAVHRDTNRQFNLSENVNVLPAIEDGSFPIEKLEPNAQALIRTDHSLTSDQEVKLEGLQTTSNPTKWTAGDLFVRLSSDTSPVNDINSFHNVGQQNGILGQFDSTTAVTFLVPNFVTVAGLERQDDNSVKISVTPIGTILNRQAFTATLPASSFDINNPVGDAWQVDGTASNAFLSGADDTFKINRSNLSDSLTSWIQSLQPDAPTPYTLPDNIRQFGEHLTVTSDTTSGWSDVSPVPIRADLMREFAALWDENRRTFTGNYFEDLTGIELISFQGNNIFYYADANDRFNTAFPGAQSYILNAPVRIRNQSGQTTISDSFRKIIGFDYALQLTPIQSTNLAMLRLGNTSTTPLMGLSEEEGLYLNIGRGDGGHRTRTIETPLQVIGGHWHDQVDQVTAAEAEIIVPSTLTGSLTVTVEIQLDDNGNDEGTHTETFTISNVGADQTIGDRTFSFSGFPSVTTTITYEHNNMDTGSSSRVIFLRPTQPFNNPALTYNVAAHYPVTESWSVSTTYARRPINAGSGHDDFGLFDPHEWNTEHVRERNRVLISFQKWEEGDTESDPELAVRVIVDGQLENSGNPIRLHRPASDFMFDDVLFGNNSVATAHIQQYLYDGEPPSGPELSRMYSQGNNWLGAFYPPGHAVDDVIIDANIELTAGHGIILVDATTGNRRLIEVDNGTITNKDA